MGVVDYLGMVLLALGIGFVVPRFDSAVTDLLARRTGLTRTQGWTVFTVATLWMFLPLLAGATVGRGRLWLVGPAVSAVGVYLAVLAVTRVDEYRLMRRATSLPADARPSPDDDLVVVSGTPRPHGDATPTTPFSGVPAVYTDWIVQRCRRIGVRRGYTGVAGGVERTPFALGDGVDVYPGDHRVLTDAENNLTFDDDDPIPEEARAHYRAHEDLPAPDSVEHDHRVLESFLPGDESVTVVGIPSQGPEPGTVRIDAAPPDTVFGTHTTQTDGASTDPEPLIVRGDERTARRRLHRNVVWLGGASVLMVLGGQLLGFVLSPATLPV